MFSTCNSFSAVLMLSLLLHSEFHSVKCTFISLTHSVQRNSRLLWAFVVLVDLNEMAHSQYCYPTDVTKNFIYHNLIYLIYLFIDIAQKSSRARLIRLWTNSELGMWMVVDDGKGARTQRNSWRAQRRVGVYLSCTGKREA